jgi:serine/threonine protein kinase
MAADQPSDGGSKDQEPLLPHRALSIGSSGQGEGQRRYKLVAQIDRGGMGELFLAELVQPNEGTRYVVIKRLLADLLDDKKYVQMFIAEAEVMSKLNHPNIVRVFDTPIIDRTQCLAMEYVRGRNLQQMLVRCRDLNIRMQPAAVLRIMSQVLRGLEYAHTFRLEDGQPLNLVHRDVTPGNVLVGFDGDVKLTDFGIAKSQMSAVSTTVGIVKGKARYLAPEQILGEPATPRSDIFSAASVVVEMMTGGPVFDRGSVPKTLYAIVNGERADLEQLLGFRAPLLVQLLNRALETNPRKRLQTAREMAEGLDAAARLIGKPMDRESLGAHLRDLFRDVDDPLSAFDPHELGHIEPATIHGFMSGGVEPALISGPGAQVMERVIPMEEIDPAEKTVPKDVAPPPIPSQRPKTAVQASAVSPEEARLIRGTPLSPAQPVPASQGKQAEAHAAVDEALSVLAWLQSGRYQQPNFQGLPALAAAAQEMQKRAAIEEQAPPHAETDDVTLAASGRQQRVPLAILFSLGAATGVMGTLAVQGLIGHSRDAKPVIAQTTPRARAAQRTPADEPAATEAIEEALPGENAPLTEEAEAARPSHVMELGPFDVRPDEEQAALNESATASVSGDSAIDLFEPKGARLRLDGQLLRDKVPIKGLVLKPGKHEIRILKGKWRKDLPFTLEPGERVDLTRRLRRHVGGAK